MALLILLLVRLGEQATFLQVLRTSGNTYRQGMWNTHSHWFKLKNNFSQLQEPAVTGEHRGSCWMAAFIGVKNRTFMPLSRAVWGYTEQMCIEKGGRIKAGFPSTSFSYYHSKSVAPPWPCLSTLSFCDLRQIRLRKLLGSYSVLVDAWWTVCLLTAESLIGMWEMSTDNPLAAACEYICLHVAD